MILVTGATGFIGSAVLTELDTRGVNVRGCVRELHQGSHVVVGNIGPDTDWSSALVGIDIIIHTAALVHVVDGTADDSLAEFRKVNVEGTLNLARRAAATNVRRFIFISSIKVNGESTSPGEYFKDTDRPNPITPYALSKWEAEQELTKIATETGMEMVIIRPPLVYGPGVKANFARLVGWVNSGLPLPFAAIHNKRSFVALDNLVDLILTCIDHPAAANQTFLVSDGEDLSTGELIKCIADGLAKPAKLFSLPPGLLRIAAILFGKRDQAMRLCSSLQVDNSKARELLGWKPVMSIKEGMQMIAWDCAGD